MFKSTWKQKIDNRNRTQKNNKMIDLSFNVSIITLNVNGLTSQIKWQEIGRMA